MQSVLGTSAAVDIQIDLGVFYYTFLGNSLWGECHNILISLHHCLTHKD